MPLEFIQTKQWTCGEYEIEFSEVEKRYGAIFWAGNERELHRLGDWPTFAEAESACNQHSEAWSKYAQAMNDIRCRGLNSGK